MTWKRGSALSVLNICQIVSILACLHVSEKCWNLHPYSDSISKYIFSLVWVLSINVGGLPKMHHDLYGCRVCLSCYQWIFHGAAVAWTKQIPILNSLPLNEKRSTVRPSDRQVLSSELNSALRSELQVLGALQALLNLIRLSRKEHTPLTHVYWHFIDTDDLESSFGWCAKFFSLHDFKDPSLRQTCLLRTGGMSFAQKRLCDIVQAKKKACNDSTLATDTIFLQKELSSASPVCPPPNTAYSNVCSE